MRKFEFTYHYIYFMLEKEEIKQVVMTPNKTMKPEMLFYKYIIATKGIEKASGYELISYKEL